MMRNCIFSHELNKKAVQLDSTCYQGVYELACDYYAGEYRTGIFESSNMEKAQYLFEKGLKLAERNNDSLFIARYQNRLKAMNLL